MQIDGMQSVSEIIGLIYDTADDPHAWPELLTALAQLLEEQQGSDSLTPSTGSVLTVVEHWLGDSNPGESIANNLIATHRFSAEEITLIEALAPHFTRAMSLHRKAQGNRSKERLASEVFDRLPIGIALIDRNQQLLYSNSRLRQIAPELVQAPRIDSQWSRLLQPRGTQLEERHSVEGKPLSLLSLPLEETGETVIFVAAPGGFKLDIDALISLFGITQSEARLACALVQGHSLEQFAEQGGVSIHTVRTQAKSLMAKTETTRQGALIAKLLASPAAFTANIDTPVSETTGQVIPPTVPAPQFLDIGVRQIAYSDLGPGEGIPVIWMHGLVGSRLQHHPSLEVLDELGLRLILLERPGVGRSPACPNYKLFDWADDVSRCADRLGLKQFMVAGYSIGAMYALTCAYRLEDRIPGLTLISPFQPPEQLSDMRGMVARNRMTLLLARLAPALLPPVVRVMIQGIRSNADDFLNKLIEQIPMDDALALSDPAVRAQYLMSVSESITLTEEGLLQDLLQAVHPWGFEARQVQQPCLIWHGDEDRHAPIALTERLARRLPNVQLQRISGAGHLLIYRHWDEILRTMHEWMGQNQEDNILRPAKTDL